MCANSHYFAHEQPTEAPTTDKSSAAKEPTDPPSQPEDMTGPTGLLIEDSTKEEDQKPSGEFIAVILKF